MASKVERIAELEAELAKTKYNKRTQHSIGLLKAKIAHLKDEQIKRSKSGPRTSGYAVSKSGDASVILVGFPSVGKSTLLNALTGTESAVAAYAFTTLSVIPGLLQHKGAKIQILDVPGIIKGAASGQGRGKEVLSVMRNADLALIVIDVFHPEHHKILAGEIEDTGLRLNKKRPDVKIVKTVKGGIDLGATVRLTKLKNKTVEAILREFKIQNAQIVIRDNIDADELIDVIEGNRIYIPAIIVINKMDLVDSDYLKKIMKKVNADICVSGNEKTNLNRLKNLIYKKLNLMRIFTKEVGKKVDMTEPLIMRRPSTVRDVCLKLHKDFVKKFRFSRVWGKSAKFPGQKHGLDHFVNDGDVVEVHIT